jgi:hypothetical protein
MRTRANGAAAAFFGVVAALAGAEAATPTVPDRFTATTAAMRPRDVHLRIDVREWSSPEARAEVVAALEGEDAAKALGGLPTVGYVWRGGSPVGYAVKYAHRTVSPAGERVTLVTDRRLGSYEFNPWTAEPPAPAGEREYSVVELYFDVGGNGTGTLSLVADVEIDATNALVSLKAGDEAPRLLQNVKTEPKPYWANGD